MYNLPESLRCREVSQRSPTPLEPPFILSLLRGALGSSMAGCCGLQEALLLNVDSKMSSEYVTWARTSYPYQ